MTGGVEWLCRLSELEDPGSRGFTLESRAGPLACFLVRRADKVYAYRNRCPHTGVPLDWTPDRFLDVEGELIQCATHGALFLIQTGECVRGPCLGAHLEPLSLEIRDGGVCLSAGGAESTDALE